MERLSVSQLNMLISRELALSPRLTGILVEAEVGRLTRHGSGHYYFSVKDHYSSIDCVMYRSSVEKNPYDFNEGDRVLLKGSISLYERNGRLQFYVTRVEPLGEGELLRAFYELKEKFSKLGLLDPERKKTIAKLPSSLALLTSATGAAYEDFMKIFRSRNPFCEVRLYPITVQGDRAVDSILEIIEDIEADCLVLTRGGGSYEDLAVFNDESLCLALSRLEVPSICAIGHEIDFTLAELVCDLRAATPSEAAELATEDVLKHLETLMTRLAFQGKNRLLELDKRRIGLSASMERMEMRFTQRLVNEDRKLTDLSNSIERLFIDKFKKEKTYVEELHHKIQGYNPREILRRGYVAIRQDDWVKRKDQLESGPAQLHFYDGVRKVEIS